MIGEGITVMVLAADNGKARLGIDAPPEVPIYREELKEHFKDGRRELPETEQDAGAGGF